ncbi:MAG: sulfite exporter TauE/SafE family protein [Burkholderiales bacterium]|nr:sulfite exporter TauE/SafE family protein [Burkholderiales bacterium]
MGALMGFFAGMLGIGGGALVVPLVTIVMRAQGLPHEHILHLAVATAMAAMIFTSSSSLRAHAARGAVRWDIWLRITPGILVGGVIGALIAGTLPTRWFALIFTGFVYYAATAMLLDIKPKASRQLPGTAGMFAAGTGISALSALVAIGGAMMSIPFMLFCNVPMLHAIGTAAAIGFPIAVSGTVGYVLSGWNAAGLPPYTLGYVYLPALAGIVVASVLTAPLGAAIAHRAPVKRLRQAFAVLFYVLATWMLSKFW